MYQITRNHVVEDLQLKDGDKELVLHVDLSVDRILQQYTKAMRTLMEAQKAIRESDMSDEKVAALGAAILGVFEVIFGRAQAEQMVDFYGEAYTEMLADVAPFINEVVAPKINEAQQRIVQKYQNVKRFHK
jgi:hypothetical protein